MAGALRIRLLTRDDEPLVRAGFAQVTRSSRQLRYGLPVREPDRALDWVRLLGQGSHVALGACIEGAPIGVARYVRRAGVAEVAVTVVDAWQSRGAGTLLLHALCTQARDAQISVFRASVLSENRRAVRLAERFGARRFNCEGGWLEYELPLEPSITGRSRRLRCLVASQARVP
jgi:RimJ/RimL family protein N-acetyltransferase